ncbi:hypothetical protein, conserved [Babesia ovata]|uniref:Uncharacterized protein n=1 Tax=Babesia ovata TaxID=189622 RepID=A0A2H6KE16_9APIC|nr:uncharacterized protein BOVATA_027200 [Babesia ovata]GBE61227.1 hypothetical protein, conserved [Babesia ovata]
MAYAMEYAHTGDVETFSDNGEPDVSENFEHELGAEDHEAELDEGFNPDDLGNEDDGDFEGDVADDEFNPEELSELGDEEVNEEASGEEGEVAEVEEAADDVDESELVCTCPDGEEDDVEAQEEAEVAPADVEDEEVAEDENPELKDGMDDAGVDTVSADEVDVGAMDLVEGMEESRETSSVVSEGHVEIPGSLTGDGKSGKRVPGKKLHWEAKASVPAYVMKTASKFKVDDISKVSITVKGQGLKNAATKIEAMSSAARESKQKLKEAVNTNKLTSQMQRSEVVAAEKARVNAAKQAREAQAERVRLEAAERRKMEAIEKQRQQLEFEKKKEALSKARREALEKSRA